MKHKRLIINAACAMMLIGCSLTAYAFADGTSADPSSTHPVSVHSGTTNDIGQGSQTVDTTNTSVHQPPKPMPQAQPNGNPNGQGKVGMKLSGDNLNRCQQRQSQINSLQSRIVTRTTNQITLFNTTTQRVETFVMSKNLSVPNYAVLTSKLETDQTTVGADLTALKANQTLDCGSTDPTGTLSDFRTNVQNMFTDMQTYKADLLKLITAVKAVVTPSQKPGTGSQTGGTAQ